MRASVLFMIVAVMATALVAPAAAQTAVRVIVNGLPLSLAAPPIVRDGQVMIPAARAFEAFGAGAAWLPDDRAIVISNRTGLVIRLRINQPTAQVNNEMRPLPVAPALVGAEPVDCRGETMRSEVDRTQGIGRGPSLDVVRHVADRPGFG